MPAQWFAVPFKRRDTRPGSPGRYCALQEFDAQIQADGGAWDAFECGGGPGSSFILGICFGKVNASLATLGEIDAFPQVMAIPAKWLGLTTSMSIATTAERVFLRDTLRQALGYTVAELDAWLGLSGSPSNAQRNTALNTKTFGQFLDFLATRWYTPVYDPNDPPGPQVGWQGTSYPGLIAVDGRTVGDVTSEPRSPVPKSPALVAANVSDT